MADKDLLLQLVIKAVDLATKDIDGVNEKVKELGESILQSPFSRAGDDMLAFGEAIKKATDPLAQATAKTLALNTAIVGVASIMASKAYESAKDYESALADLAKVLDGGMDAAKGYGARLNETAQQFAQNGQDLVKAMTNFVQAGYSAEEAFNLVTESTKLMIAGDLEAAQSSEYLVSILKGFKAEASDAGRVVDLLNEVSNEYATDVKELASGMAALSPIAKTMGFSMEETAGLLTPVIEVYRSGSEAADALKTALQQLSANTIPVKSALASLGVSQTDVNGVMRNGKDIFLDVAKSFIGLSDAQKGYYAQELAGIDQAGRFGTVIQNVGTYLKVTDVALNSAGSAMQEVTTRMATAEATGKRAEESFRQLSVTIGNAFKPQIQGLVAATGDLAAAFDRSIKAGDLSPLLNVLKPQIAAVETLVRAMANNLEEAIGGVDWHPLVEGLKAVSGELGEAFAQLTEGMDLTTVDGLRTLLQAIINILGDFSQFVAGAVDGLKPLIGALNSLFAVATAGYPELSRLAGEIAGFATSANQIIPVISQMGSVAFNAIGTIAELAVKIGLFVAALKLLSAAGVPVVEILGNLTRAFFALNPAIISVGSALAGFPGILLAVELGVGALGYGIGTLVNKFVEWATGGMSVGTMLADLVDKLTGYNTEVTRSATLEEEAVARANRLETAKRNQAKAQEEATQKEIEAQQAAANTAAAQEARLRLHASEQATIDRLKASYAAMGLVYDETTGKILRQGEATAQQQQKSRELGDALDKLGVSANYMAERITAAGAETIATFRSIITNAQATSTQVEAAFRASIDSAHTQGEVQKILAAYEEWANGAGKSAANVSAAMQLADDKTKELKKSTEELSPALKALLAVTGDELEVKKLQALASGRFSDALKIEQEQLRQNTKDTSDNAEAADKAAKAKDAEADASTRVAEDLKAAAEEAKGAGDAISKVYNSALAAVSELGSRAVTAFKQARGEIIPTGDALDQLQAQVERTAGEIARAAASGDGFVNFLNKITSDAVQVQAAFVSEARAADQLTERLNAAGDGVGMTDAAMQQLIRTAQSAQRGFVVLDDTRLDRLNAAIDAATERLNKMKKETEDAKTRLEELNAELLSAQGEDTKAKLLEQQIDYQKQLAEIKKQIAEAEASGNRELLATLNEQLAVLEKINAVKVRNIESDTTGGDTATRLTTAWTAAGSAIQSAGSALNEVYTATDKLSRVDLSGLHKQFSGVADQAGKLASVL